MKERTVSMGWLLVLQLAAGLQGCIGFSVALSTQSFLPSVPRRRSTPGSKYQAPGDTHSERSRSALFNLGSVDGDDSNGEDAGADVPAEQPAKASKRAMMGFAIPALGIFLTNPLLSNIDNAFVGNMVGTAGLAALSPATICTDQMLYLFSFLGRATTGLVSRAYAAGPDGNGGDVDAAREAASAPLTVAIVCGLVLSGLYAAFTPWMLSVLAVDPALRSNAASYIHWRGAITWAALAQNVSLQVMLATRDAVTPLKIVALAAVFNVIGDALLCVWPFRWGCAGAAAATSVATLVSSGFMLRALARRRLLPSLRVPGRKELVGLLEFTGPLLAVTITRLLGFVAMQRQAMKLGVQQLAGYQLCINVVIFFLLFAEPLSQLSQTKLPSLVDNDDGDAVLANLKSIASLALGASLVVGGLAYSTLRFGSGIFTGDAGVQLLAQQAAPAVFLNVATAIVCVAADGAMLASRDFGFMLAVGVMTYLVQTRLLGSCASLSAIFATFTLRLGIYTVACVARAVSGGGALGRAIRNRRKLNAAI